MGLGADGTEVVQILKVVYSAEELNKVKKELSDRGRQFITKNPGYTYELSIVQETFSFVIHFILRPKNQTELEELYGDY